jgi:hypothetical protein
MYLLLGIVLLAAFSEGNYYLFDLDKDPYETTSVYGQPEYANVTQFLLDIDTF